MRKDLWTRRAYSAASQRLVAIALIAAGASSAYAYAGDPLPEQWTRLAAMFDKTLEQDSMMGGSIALVENGRIVARRDYGYADKASGRRVDADTIFHWASITKTLNGVTVMQLRDRGLLSLDEPITRYVPELRQMHDPFGSMDAITIRMLLNHSAGFQASTWPYRQGAAWEPFEPTRWEQLVAMMPYQQVEFPPGSKFSYSNPAWIYLARALETLTGDPWEYYVQKNIFTPLGMSRSYFSHTPPHLKAHRSHGYLVRRQDDGKLISEDMGADFDPGVTIPNGGWNAPLDDVAAYIAFLTDATGGDAEKKRRFESVLSRATLEEMWRPLLPVSWGGEAPAEHMGLSFFLLDQGARRIVGHTGSQGGYITFFYCDPGSGRGVIGALNTGNSARGEGKPPAYQTIRTEALKVFQ